MRVLSLDGGKRHFAIASIQADPGCSACIKHLGVMQSPMDDLKPATVNQSSALFMDEIRPFIEEADSVVFERVIQQPGRTCGSSVEYIGVSLGMILSQCRDLGKPLVPVMASTWKPMTKKNFQPWASSAELFNQPPVVKSRKSNIISDHEFDALGIALWYLTKLGMDFNQVREDIAHDVLQVIENRRKA